MIRRGFFVSSLVWSQARFGRGRFEEWRVFYPYSFRNTLSKSCVSSRIRLPFSLNPSHWPDRWATFVQSSKAVCAVEIALSGCSRGIAVVGRHSIIWKQGGQISRRSNFSRPLGDELPSKFSTSTLVSTQNVNNRIPLLIELSLSPT
jgi:hypothetical protein